MFSVISVPEWELYSAFILLICGQLYKFWTEYLKDRRDRQAEENKIAVLRDIAESNLKINNAQVAQNGKLSAIVSVNDAHHQELIRTLESTCRFAHVDRESKQT